MAASPRNLPASDENQVLTIIGLGLITLVLACGCGYWFYKHLQERETRAAQSALYRDYQRNTAPPATPAPLSPALQEARYVREKLLKHPGVTPAAGFMRPGVQSTGNAIVDAIDHAQAREKARKASGS